MSSSEFKATDPSYQSPYASDPTSSSARVAAGLSAIRGPNAEDGSGRVGAAGGGASPQMLAQVLRRMGGGGAAGMGASAPGGFAGGGAAGSGWAGMNRQMYPPTQGAMGSGSSGQGGFNFGTQTSMSGAGGPPGVMGQQGPAQSGAMRQAPLGGASGFSGGGGTMWAGGSPTFDEGAGGRFIGGDGLPGAAGGGMSPGMGAVPRTAGGMSFAPGASGAGQADPWQQFLAQYSQQ